MLRKFHHLFLYFRSGQLSFLPVDPSSLIAESGSFCRLCLKTDSIEVVFQSPEDANESLLGIISECLSIWLTVTEDFPLAICHSCSMSIEAIRQFRYNCQQCDFYLRSHRSAVGAGQNPTSAVVVDSDLDSTGEQKPVIGQIDQIDATMMQQETYSVQEVHYEESAISGTHEANQLGTVYGGQMTEQVGTALGLGLPYLRTHNILYETSSSRWVQRVALHITEYLLLLFCN